MRDNSFLVKQLGIDLIDAATHFAELPTSERFENWREQEVARVKAGKLTSHQWHTPIDENSAEFAHRWVDTFFNKKAFGKMKDFYHVNARLQWPGGVEAVGISGIRGVFIQWLTQCPDAVATCDHISAVAFENAGTDIAIRWSVAGTFNSKKDSLKKYSGQCFFVLGATHLRIIDGKISEEWTVFDEVAAYANLIRDFNSIDAEQGV
jgi:hypothetical protein